MNNSETVKMTIKPGAVKKLKDKAANVQVVLLALNDGSNKYSNAGGTCTIGANFQFVILRQQDPDFTVRVDNNAGLDLYTSPAELQFLENNLVVDEKNTALNLSDDSGIVDGAVTISEYAGK